MELSEFRIYVASLADYNDSRLYGVWIDLEDCASLDDLQDAVNAMLATSPFAASDFAKKHGLLAEEYAIHDYEGFPQGSVSEHSGLSEVWNLFEAFEQADNHGYLDAFVVYHEHFNSLDFSDFQDCYQGEYKSEVDYVEQFVDDTGMLDNVPDTLKNYFDYEAYARDVFCGDCVFVEGYVFWNN